MRKLFNILYVVLFLAGLTINGWSATKTNLEILEQNYFAMFSHMLSTVTLSDSQCVIEKEKSPLDYDWLIEQQLYKCLLAANVRHVFVNQHVEKSMRVTYNPVLQTIVYNRLKKKQVERFIHVQIHCRIADAQNQVLMTDLLQTTFTDTIGANEIKNLENVGLAFTVGKREKSLLAILYEPVIVTAITGLIIYLFYSYRSQ